MSATPQTIPDERTAWAALGEVVDPEIPVLTLVELKVVREVEVTGDAVRVVLTPTFIGCPAFEMMQRETRAALERAGFRSVTIEVTYSPPWSSDWLEEPARRKLREIGIAPPNPAAPTAQQALAQPLTCPHCGSQQTRLDTPFGPTLCRMIAICDACRQPFEAMKPL